MLDADTRLLGRTVGGYRIESYLGRGSNGTVYLATRPRLSDKVALKVISADAKSRSGVRERFLRESRLAASLDHPNVIPIYEAGDDDGELYIAMAYAAGGDLRSVLDREGGRLSLVRTIAIVEQVAAALDAAHAASLLHLDLKLTNVLLGAAGRVYLSDFGGACAMGPAGTSDPFAPSAHELTPEDVWGDIRGLGTVAYRCLVGEAPSELAAFRENQPGRRPPLSASRPGLPAALEGVLAAATEPPRGRYPTAGSMARAFRVAGLGPDSLGITLRPA